MQVYDLLIAILPLGSPSGNRLLDVPSWRRTPLGNRKRCLHRLSRLTCLLILCLLQFPRIAQRGCCRANPDLMSESHSEPDVELVREGRNSRKESKKGGREKELRNSQEKRP